MKVLVCHPGTQHAGKLAGILKRENLLGGFCTGFRVKPDSMLGRWLRLSGIRALDESLSQCTQEIWAPELLGKAAQCLGWGGESLMRLRNAWFQRLVPQQAIASGDAVIGFDTASWILARRVRKMGTPFILDRAAVHRATRASIRTTFGITDSAEQSAGGRQDELESDEIALASRIVVASRFTERSLLDAGIPAEKIAVIPYGVNWDWFAAQPEPPRTAGKLVFLFVGLLKTEKGIGILLEAWKRLGASEAELWLVGSGDPEVIQSARDVAGVRVMGKLGPDDLREAYHGASVFVFPTFCDGFGLVLLEAMSSGLPIIATPNCAAPELVHAGAAGLIVPAGDPAALCSAMADACANRSAWIARGAAAREIAKTYSWESYGTRWAALLREVIG